MEKAGGAWTASSNALAPLKDFDGLEHIFMAKSTKVGVPEPCIPAEVKHKPSWPLQENEIQEEQAMLKEPGGLKKCQQG